MKNYTDARNSSVGVFLYCYSFQNFLSRLLY